MDSDETTLIALSLLLFLSKQPQRRRGHRKYWVHPFNKERLRGGHYVTTFQKLKHYKKEFRKCYRMSYSTFRELLSLVKPDLTYKNTVMRECISAEERLVITLR